MNNMKNWETKIVKEFDFVSKCEYVGYDNHAIYLDGVDEDGNPIELKIVKDDSGFSDDCELWYKEGEDWEYADVI